MVLTVAIDADQLQGSDDHVDDRRRSTQFQVVHRNCKTDSRFVLAGAQKFLVPRHFAQHQRLEGLVRQGQIDQLCRSASRFDRPARAPLRITCRALVSAASAMPSHTEAHRVCEDGNIVYSEIVE